MISKWHILGAGAIGSLYASRLQSGGAQVTLINRSTCPRKRTVSVEHGNEREMFFFDQVSVDQISMTTKKPINNLLICTKSWAAMDAFASVKNCLSPGSQVVLLCNGMGIAESLIPLMEKNWMLAIGSTTAGCRFDKQGILHISNEGETCMGWFKKKEAQPTWTAIWTHGVSKFSWEDDVLPSLLEKTAINAVINPLTAIHKISNGELLSKRMEELRVRVTSEIQALLNATGEHTIASRLPSRVEQVCRLTSTNHSSMRIDLERGRKTEIDSIITWLLDSKANLKKPLRTPTLSMLKDKIKKAEPNP